MGRGFDARPFTSPALDAVDRSGATVAGLVGLDTVPQQRHPISFGNSDAVARHVTPLRRQPVQDKPCHARGGAGRCVKSGRLRAQGRNLSVGRSDAFTASAVSPAVKQPTLGRPNSARARSTCRAPNTKRVALFRDESGGGWGVPTGSFAEESMTACTSTSVPHRLADRLAQIEMSPSDAVLLSRLRRP